MNNNFTKEAHTLFQSYPQEIQDQLVELFSSVLHIVDLLNLVSIVFIGSGARNELSYRLEQNKVDIFSDYEFLIIVRKKLSRKKYELLNKQFRSLEKKWDVKSPLFYIDYGVATLTKFKQTPPTLWAYEVKNFGTIIYGRDVRKDLKEVTIQNLDIGNLNELIIIRLWNMLIHTNNAFVKNKSSEYELFIVKFFYVRNILDIITILLPNHGVLIGGYKNRTQYIVHEFQHEIWDSYRTDFKAITALKIDLKDDVPLEHAQTIFLNGYLRLIADIAGLSQIDTLYDLENKKKQLISKHIFKEKLIRTMRRKYIEYTLFKTYYHYSLSSVPLFFHDTIRINMLFCLLFLHQSLVSTNSTEEKKQCLEKSIAYFNILSVNKKYVYNEVDSFEDTVIDFRYALLDVMMIWLYSRTNTTQEDIKKHITWTEINK